MTRFKDTFDATRGSDEDNLKLFAEAVKNANAKVDRSFRAKTTEDAPVEKGINKSPKPMSEPE